MLLSPRYLPRLSATVGLFTRYGLHDVAKRQGLLALAPPDEHGALEVGSTDQSKARAFRERLVELGPAYVKLGQVLSTRPDILPQPYIDELQRLQDDVPALPEPEVEAVIEAELGARVRTLFGSFDPEPLGSASLGQVHAATLRDGRPVVVKVQRPGVREQLVEDIGFFQELAAFATAHTEQGRQLDLVGVVEQVQRSLTDELDYRTEARNGAMLRRNLATFPHIVIPRVIEAYTTARVLTTERIFGRRIDEIPPITRVDHDFALLAAELARAYLKQIAVDGYFHADPHPGNLFVILPDARPNPPTPAELRAHERRAESRPAASPLAEMEQDARARAAAEPAAATDARVALIDFGMMGRLPERLRERVVRLLVALGDNRGEEAADVLAELGNAPLDFERTAYERDVATIVAANVERSVSETATGRVLVQVIETGFRYGLVLPSELTMLAKAVFNLDAVTRALDPTFNTAAAIRDYAMQIADERARHELSPQRLLQSAEGAITLMRVLPHRLDVITERLAANELAIRLDTPQLVQQLEGMQKLANRIFAGLVLLGLLVASGLLMPYRPVLGTGGFVIAGAIGFVMLVRILATDRPRKRASAR